VSPCISCAAEVEAGACLHCGRLRPGAPTEAGAARVEENAGPTVASPQSTAAAGERQEAADGRHDEKLLSETFKKRRLVLKGLKFPLNVLMYAAIAQTVIVAALLLTQKLPQPQVNSGVQDQAGGTYTVPLGAFVVTAISIAAGYCLALAGALRIRAAAGLPIIAAVTVGLATIPISKLRVGGADIEPHVTEVGLRWGQLGVLGLLWAWLAWRAAGRRASRRAQGSGVASQPSAQRRHGRLILVGALAVVGAYYLLELGVWAAYARAGQRAAGTGFLLDDLSFQTVLLPFFLTLVVLLGSTDLLEWGELTARWTVAQVRRVQPRWVLILTPLAALAVVANVLRLAPGAVPLELVVGVILAGVVSLLVRSARGYAAWSDDLRSRAVFLGAVAIFLYTTMFYDALSYLGSALGLAPALVVRLYWLVSVPLLLAALIAAAVWLLRGRPARRERRTMGLFLVLAGMLTLVAGLPSFLGASHLPAVYPRHFSLLSAIQLVAALGALIWTGGLLARKKKQAPVAPVARALLLLAGLELVTLIISLLNGIASLSALSAFWLAGLFLLLGFWGLITSGDQLNADQPAGAPYPRDGRIMLFASYTLIANATLLYLGALRVPRTGGGPAAILTSDYVTPAGLGILGASLVVLAFLLRRPGRAPTRRSSAPADSGPPRPATDAEPPAPPPGPASAPARAPVASSRTSRRLFRSTVLLAALGLLFVSGCSTASQLSRTNVKLLSQPYHTPVPGPGCDARGANWSVPPGDALRTRCLKAGLQVVALHQGSGDVQFLPPGGSFPGNYRVSVRVELSQLPDGCVSIYTRASAAGHYSSSICTSTAGTQARAWNIQRIQQAPGQWLLGVGALDVSMTYQLTATTEGSDQQITINGATADGTDAVLAVTRYIALGISNSSPQAASVIFSDFRFTPLTSRGSAVVAGRALPVTTRDRVVVWYADTGTAELALLTKQVDGVGLARGLPAQGLACAKLGAAVTAARAEPPVPDVAAQPWLAMALDEFAKSAADCRAGASAHSSALLSQAAAATRAATGDIRQFNVAISHD
jgi:hypothetical protein